MGYARRNFLVPIPTYRSFDELNALLEEKCLERMERRLRGHKETIGERMVRDIDVLLPLPSTPYDASDKHTTRVSSSVIGEIPHQRLLGARGLRTQGGAGTRIRGPRW